MSDKYRIYEQDKAYFITMTVVGWVDVFTRLGQRRAIIDSLKYCQQNKGLIVYAYCIMPNHIHAIVQADDGFNLSDILRDFKKFTSKKIIELISSEPESRREWMLREFEKACERLKRDQQYKVWQDGNHAEVLFSNKFLRQKLDYIHNNPVKDMIVDEPCHYWFSSARNYAGLDYLMEVELLTIEVE